MEDPIDLARAGLSDREIERRTGISRKRVARLRREHNIPAWTAPLAEHGTQQRARQGCDCDPCRAAHLEYRHHLKSWPEHQPPMAAERSAALVERARQIQSETREAATRTMARWTDDELAVALDYQHTAGEAAELLGRSLAAVRHIRKKRRALPERIPYRPRTS